MIWRKKLLNKLNNGANWDDDGIQYPAFEYQILKKCKYGIIAYQEITYGFTLFEITYTRFYSITICNWSFSYINYNNGNL